jgi:ABC transport system ATP-binding/permease protein
MADDRGATVLSANNLSISFGTLDILVDSSLTVHEQDRIGIVGRNGAGKSTLLKIISGNETATSGTISKKKNLRVSYLPQNFELDEDKSVFENVLQGAAYTLGLIEEYESIDHESPKAFRLEEEITHLNGWDIEQQAEVLMESLSTPPANSRAGDLSGGEKRRVAMCKALISEPEFLILDEPTNHLDTESIEWLENYLKKFQGAILLVTHDRYFLDRVSTHIFEVAAGKVRAYPGNYSSYLVQKAEEEVTAELVDHKRQQHLKKELAWVRAGVKARGTKSKSRVQRYHDAAEGAGFEKQMDMDLVIPKAPTMGNKTVNLTNVSKTYDGKTLFENLDLEFEPDTRIGIVGKNGLGKTTLVNIILENVAPDTGTVEVGQRTMFNYVDQNRIALDPNKSVLEEISDDNDWVTLGDEKISVRGYLKRFLFTDEKINTKISRLSGGEKSRLTLAKILKRGGNFLILDEPTNDLDLPTLRMLEEALVNFDGCVLVISHDRYFLNRVCQGILAFEGDGKLSYQDGNYDYYLEKKKDKDKEVPVPVKAAPPIESKAKTKEPSKLTWKEERELEGMENKIFALEDRVSEIQELFAQTDFYEKHGDKASDLNEELSTLKSQVKTLYARWEKLDNLKNSQ